MLDLLNEILALIFSKTLQIQLTKGLYLGYVNVEENTKALKGSIIIKNHIKNISTSSSNVFCSFEEFTINNSLNQIFNTCISKTIRNIKNTETIKILKHIQGVLTDME